MILSEHGVTLFLFLLTSALHLPSDIFIFQVSLTKPKNSKCIEKLSFPFTKVDCYLTELTLNHSNLSSQYLL